MFHGVSGSYAGLILCLKLFFKHEGHLYKGFWVSRLRSSGGSSLGFKFRIYTRLFLQCNMERT